MSRTTIKAIWPGEKVDDLEELGNAWGSAPVVWDAMCGRYLSGESAWISSAESGKLWKLADRTDIPAAHRAVLMMTFDLAYVLKEDYSRAAKDIRQFLDDFPIDPARVNHWPRIAALFESDPDVPAIGFHHTSVSEDPFLGPWNEQAEDYDPLDWSWFYSIYLPLEKK